MVFYHPVKDVALAVHGDDFTFCGVDEEIRWIRGKLESWFEVKVRVIWAPDPYDDKEVTILGRIVRWTKGGIE